MNCGEQRSSISAPQMAAVGLIQRAVRLLGRNPEVTEAVGVRRNCSTGQREERMEL